MASHNQIEWAQMPATGHLLIGTNSGWGDETIVSSSSSPFTFGFFPLFLISITFLCEFECKVGTKVGLAAGRYSGNSRPERYRTPQALHSVFGPNGPSLHCGVLVISQCVHFLGQLGGARGTDFSASSSDFFLLNLSFEARLDVEVK
ncbi:small integral membrane protein 8 [Striga asiatica]|uniref:Small integral membrane protein 8 n=1 Tax=Striga asiatica TaxID=4170 RepID=A0A5A7PKY7_STRAF|nr:small integral membrane protein 8 [Striga asiatica]